MAVVDLSLTGPLYPQTNQRSDAGTRKEPNNISQSQVADDRITTYTLWLAIFTGVLSLSTIGLWGATYRAGNVAERALVAGERAFVFAIGVTPFFDKPADPANPVYNWRFRPRWQNSGDTPTKNMTMHTECVLRDAILPAGFDFDHAVTTEIGKVLIPPKVITMGGIAPQSPNPAITPQDIAEAQIGRKLIYVWGWARYYGVFPNTPQHITRFCFVMVPIGNPHSATANKDLTWDFISDAEGNCADDECT